MRDRADRRGTALLHLEGYVREGIASSEEENMSRRNRGCLVLVVLVGLHAAGAQAGLISYTSSAAFNAATTGVTSYGIPFPATCCAQHVEPSTTIGPLTFGATSLVLFNDGFYGVGLPYLDGNGSDMTVALAGATALSFRLGTFWGGDSIDIYVNGVLATTVTESSGQPSSLFIGFTDSDPITSLTFHNASSSDFITDELDVLGFAVASSIVTNPAPEPGTLALLSLGLFGLALTRQRKQ